MSKRAFAVALSTVCLVAAGLAGYFATAGTGSSVPTALTVGQTIQADPSTMVDTAKAVTFTDQGKSYLCQTTITGVDYHNNWQNYVGGKWQLGLGSLRLAMTIAPDTVTSTGRTAKQLYDDADIALEQTTITGKKYCMNPSKWPSGFWAAAFADLAQVRSYLVANPSTDGPSIKVVP